MTKTSGLHLYLVRHGESANNAQPDHQRVPDPALTDLGHKQARNLARHYEDFDRIDHVLVSPFRRTLQTAQPLLETRGVRGSIWTDIYEVGGCYSGHEAGELMGQPGMTDEDIRNEFPAFDIPADINQHGWYKSKPFETWEMAIPRASQQAAKLRTTFANQDSVVFCFIHADFKQLLLQHLVPAEKDYHGSGITNSSVTYLHFHDNKGTHGNKGTTGADGKVIDYCNTDHLSDADISY